MHIISFKFRRMYSPQGRSGLFWVVFSFVDLKQIERVKLAYSENVQIISSGVGWLLLQR